MENITICKADDCPETLEGAIISITRELSVLDRPAKERKEFFDSEATRLADVLERFLPAATLWRLMSLLTDREAKMRKEEGWQ